MTEREHHHLIARGRIEATKLFGARLAMTIEALVELLNYNDQHMLDCKHNGPNLDDLNAAQREKEQVEAQLDSIFMGVESGAIPKDQLPLIEATVIMTLRNRLQRIGEDITAMQAEMEAAEVNE